jgi:hypothetical protein
LKGIRDRALLLLGLVALDVSRPRAVRIEQPHSRCRILSNRANVGDDKGRE